MTEANKDVTDVCWKVYDSAQSFVFPSYAMYGLLNQNVSIGLFFSQKETKIVFCLWQETFVHGQCQKSKRIQQNLLGFKTILSINLTGIK